MNSWTFSFLYKVGSPCNRVLIKACWGFVKLLDWPRGMLSAHSFAKNAEIGRDFRVSSSGFCVNLNPDKKAKVGNGVVCRGSVRIEERGSFEIGDNSYIGDGTIINAMGRVRIGAGVLIAQNCFIVDNNTHPLDGGDRALHFASFLPGRERFDLYGKVSHADISFGDGAWIGAGSIILKGVTVGKGAIIAAGSIVTESVPDHTLYAGNPAVEVRRLV